ncbi:MAG: ribokinase [Spirochaetaceae bacterium]|nr:ribokinase [Spirochaetaceae bacterium]
MSDRQEICVVGSVNTDLHACVERFPLAGETVGATGFGVSGGGKGANQAVALAKLGARPFLVAKLGDDAFGRDRLADFLALGMDLSGIRVESGVSSGVALVETESGGQNRIVIAAGANAAVDESFVLSLGPRIAGAAFVLFQLELPLASVRRGLSIAKAGGAATILDPAPAAPLPDDIFALVDYLTPNETETETLTGILPDSRDKAIAAAARLLARGAGRVIIKAGSRGAYLFGPEGLALRCAAFPVAAVDTTAAGDAFNAGFAAALAEGRSEAEALRFACAVGALATTRRGAQTAVPDRAETESLLAAHPGLGAERF